MIHSKCSRFKATVQPWVGSLPKAESPLKSSLNSPALTHLYLRNACGSVRGSASGNTAPRTSEGSPGSLTKPPVSSAVAYTRVFTAPLRRLNHNGLAERNSDRLKSSACFSLCCHSSLASLVTSFSGFAVQRLGAVSSITFMVIFEQSHRQMKCCLSKISNSTWNLFFLWICKGTWVTADIPEPALTELLYLAIQW